MKYSWLTTSKTPENEFSNDFSSIFKNTPEYDADTSSPGTRYTWDLRRYHIHDWLPRNPPRINFRTIFLWFLKILPKMMPTRAPRAPGLPGTFVDVIFVIDYIENSLDQIFGRFLFDFQKFSRRWCRIELPGTRYTRDLRRCHIRDWLPGKPPWTNFRKIFIRFKKILPKIMATRAPRA